MLKIKPEFWTKSGGKKFVVMTLADFERIQELVEDAGLARILKQAKRKEAEAPTISLNEMKKKLGMAPQRTGRAK